MDDKQIRLGNIKSSKNKFSPEEDRRLKHIVLNAGNFVDWQVISMEMKNKTARQCRERYNNYLKPGLKKDDWTPKEDEIIWQKYKEFGSRWNVITKFLKGRTGNSVRNRILALKRRSKSNRNQDVHDEKDKQTEVEMGNCRTKFPSILEMLSDAEIQIKNDLLLPIYVNYG